MLYLDNFERVTSESDRLLWQETLREPNQPNSTEEMSHFALQNMGLAGLATEWYLAYINIYSRAQPDLQWIQTNL